MKTYKLALLAFVLLTLAACAIPPGALVTEVPEPTDSIDPTPSTGGPPGPEPVVEIYSVEWLATLPPETILLQMDYEPTFFREEAFYEFGRIPPFTLFADGNVVYLDSGETFDQQQLLIAHLEPEEVSTLLHEVRDAGFTGLEDWLDFCGPAEDGQEVCIADAAYTILRMILPDGTLREVKSYANFSNDPGAFQEIVLIMDEYTNPDAVFYMPHMAVLFIRALPGDLEVPVREWPLPEDRIPPLSEALAAVVLEPAAAETFVTAVGANTGEWFFQSGTTVFSAYLVPWLPYADYTEEVFAQFPPVTPEPVEEPFLMIQRTAVTNLAIALGIPESEITVTEFNEVTWPNGCLGITNIEMACTQALVPGFQIILTANGQTYEYRSDREGTVVLPAGENPLPPVETPAA